MFRSYGATNTSTNLGFYKGLTPTELNACMLNFSANTSSNLGFYKGITPTELTAGTVNFSTKIRLLWSQMAK